MREREYRRAVHRLQQLDEAPAPAPGSEEHQLREVLRHQVKRFELGRRGQLSYGTGSKRFLKLLEQVLSVLVVLGVPAIQGVPAMLGTGAIQGAGKVDTGIGNGSKAGDTHATTYTFTS